MFSEYQIRKEKFSKNFEITKFVLDEKWLKQKKKGVQYFESLQTPSFPKIFWQKGGIYSVTLWLFP